MANGDISNLTCIASITQLLLTRTYTESNDEKHNGVPASIQWLAASSSGPPVRGPRAAVTSGQCQQFPDSPSQQSLFNSTPTIHNRGYDKYDW